MDNNIKGNASSEQDKSSPSARLLSAAKEGNIEEAKRALAEGASARFEDENGLTPAMHAVAASSINIFELVAKESDLGHIDKEGNSIVMHAVLTENANVVERVLHAAYDWHARKVASETTSALMGLWGGDEDSIPYFWSARSQLQKELRSVPGINHKNNKGAAPLASAVREGLTEIVDLLLRYGADPALSDPAVSAAIAGNTEMLKIFIQNKVNVDIPDKEGRALISYTAEAGNLESSMVLMSAGASVHRRDAKGLTPMMRAEENNDAAMVKLLNTRVGVLRSELRKREKIQKAKVT